jgi:hypothetical protein
MKRTPLTRRTPLRKVSPNPAARQANARIRDNSVNAWKSRVWDETSVIVRLRDADAEGFVSCCTCGVRKHWRRVDAGHFLDGRTNGTLFDLRGIHPQCKPCNGNLKQAPKDTKIRYEAFMLERYGREVVDELRALARSTRQFTVAELVAMREERREIARSLKSRHIHE